MDDTTKRTRQAPPVMLRALRLLALDHTAAFESTTFTHAKAEKRLLEAGYPATGMPPGKTWRDIAGMDDNAFRDALHACCTLGSARQTKQAPADRIF